MKATRQLTDQFMADLLSGILKPVLERVRSDQTLMLALRGNYVNVYYRGGNLMKITANRTTHCAPYKAYFDKKYSDDEYNKTHHPKLPEPPHLISSRDDAQSWVDAFPVLKEIMDFHLCQSPKPEKESQQLVARQNNNSTISGGTEYFITDIEVADSGIGARFDMLGIYWSAKDRKRGLRCRPVLIEMKYGSACLGGNAGLIKHLEDMRALIGTKEKLEALTSTASSQFNQLHKLGLFNYNRSTGLTGIKVSGRPQVVFLLADLNPRSKILGDILSDSRFEEYSSQFDLRFFAASFAGYGMHSDCLLTLSEFRKTIGRRRKRQFASLDFVYIDTIEPERDPEGMIREFKPQSSYDNRQGLPLNPHGEGPFCKFSVARDSNAAGVYVLTVELEPVYAGKCICLSERWGSRGYGTISPKNCFTGGQSTNCKVNSGILQEAKAGRRLDLWFHPTTDIDETEQSVLLALKPSWNDQMP